MAKINARGAREVARLRTKARTLSTGTKVTTTFVLRSDGKVLSSATYKEADGGGFRDGLKVTGTVGTTNVTAGALRSFVLRRGYEVA